MTAFDELTRGEQFRLLRIRDFQNSITMLEDFIRTEQSLLERYLYPEWDKVRIGQMVREAHEDIAYYRKQIAEYGGAENEVFLTGQKPESPTDRYTGITCTTVI